MVYGIWYMVYGKWYIWYMVYGIWYMVYGIEIVGLIHIYVYMVCGVCI
jgi:hypothetical protein